MWNLNISGKSQSMEIYSDVPPPASDSVGAKKLRLHDVTNRNTGRATMEKISTKPESQSVPEHLVVKTVEKAENLDVSHEKLLRYCREKFAASLTELDENAQDKMTTFRQSIKWTSQCFQQVITLQKPYPEDNPDYQVAKVKYDLAMDNLRKLVE